MTTTTMTIPTTRVCDTCDGNGYVLEQHDYASERLGCPDCQGEGRLPARPLPSLTVEAYSTESGMRCEFEPDECYGEVAYSVTPPTHQDEPELVHPDDEFTTFVCREHLGRLIALRLAGVY